MGQKFDFSEEIKRVNEIKDKNERMKALSELAAKKRRQIGGLRGRKVKIRLSKKAKAGFLSINVGENVTGYVSDVSDTTCKLDDAKPMHLRTTNTDKILSVELI